MKNSTKKVSSTSKTRFNVAHENMLYNIIAFALAAANIAITSSVAAFNTLITTIQSKLATVDSLRAVTRVPITGYASQKKALRTALVAMSRDIMNAVYSYALDTNNEVLAKQMRNAPTQLKLGDRQLLQFVSGIVNIVGPLATAGTLSAYNVTAASVTTWQSLVTQLTALMSNPQNAVANRVAINKSIYQLLNQCMFMLTNNADTLINQFRTTYPDYYNTYWANRRLHEHSLSTQLRAHVTNLTGAPVTLGIIYIIGTDRSGVIGSDGYCLVDDIPFGQYEVMVTTSSAEAAFGPFDFKKGHSLTEHFVVPQSPPTGAPKTTEEGTAEVTKTPAGK